MPDLATIGYQNATLPKVIARLKAAGVEVLVDLRAVAASRRAGFSETLPANGLAEAGIGYVHLRGFGTPKPGREAARRGDVATMRAICAGHLATPEAEHDMARATTIASERRAALLCFEADAAGCHRRIVADLLRRQLGVQVRDL